MPTVYVTAPPDAAADLARALVEERLAACVNRVPCQSVYRWDGDVHDDEEVILLAKTTDERYDDLVSRVVELHPYDVPCIERFDESHVLDAYTSWVEDEVR
ncbi:MULTISPECIES: divalent-cation tolerance protein CutA [Haloferax]|uniref:Divalent cation tolerance protein CutA n=2 Tax=Haloferax TaxID=2251 RepID=A0A6G1Z3K7_9EURY|nr:MULTISPECIES: divalent-cation tolerance protein CutA [Haloferax]KAB1188430.1 divalent-cation tolerance protein CutA [Haloferax sp. CBA1149]MRW81122.1 divalent cation tolerance protein CutA [Haloferax marinisediminis]